MNILSFLFGVGVGVYITKYDVIDMKKDIVTIEHTSSGDIVYKLFGMNMVNIRK